MAVNGAVSIRVVGSANCASIHASKPFCRISATKACVGPNVACSAKRDAAYTLTWLDVTAGATWPDELDGVLPSSAFLPPQALRICAAQSSQSQAKYFWWCIPFPPSFAGASVNALPRKKLAVHATSSAKGNALSIVPMRYCFRSCYRTIHGLKGQFGYKFTSPTGPDRRHTNRALHRQLAWWLRYRNQNTPCWVFRFHRVLWPAAQRAAFA